MDYKDRLELFKEELVLISSDSVRDFVKECLKQAPDYIFEDCPSSSSGKYHPIEELGADGTIIHTKKVFATAYELSRAFECEHHRDEVCAAALLHDMAKQGFGRSGHTVPDHPQLMAKLVADVYNNRFKDKIPKKSAMIIYNCIFYHYGQWTDKSVRKPLVEYTPEEKTVFISDYITSKRFVHIDYKRNLLGA